MKIPRGHALFIIMEAARAYDLAVIKQRKRRIYCEQYLSKSTYYRHKSIYYDPSNETWSKFANVDEIETACSSEGEDVSDGDETAVQDCVGVYCTEEADDNDIDSSCLSPPSPKLPPLNFEELNGSLIDDDNNEMQGHL